MNIAFKRHTNLQRLMSCEKWIPKGYIIYDSIYITFLKWPNYRNGEEMSGCQGEN